MYSTHLHVGDLLLGLVVRDCVVIVPALGAQLDEFEQLEARRYIQPFVLRSVAENDEGPVQCILGHRLQLRSMHPEVVQEQRDRFRRGVARLKTDGHVVYQLD